MVLEAAVIPRDSRVKQLERTVSEQASVVQELNQQRANYITQLSGVNQRLAEVEMKLSSMEMKVHEKDTVIQVLQNSFLNPDDTIQDEHISNSSSVLHHSPVAAKKYGFPIGSPVDMDRTVSLPADMSSVPVPPYSQSPLTPPLRRGLPTGTHGVPQHNSRLQPGGQSSTHAQLYTDKGQPGGQSSPHAQLYADKGQLYVNKGQPGGQTSPHAQLYTEISQRTVSSSRSLSPVKRQSGTPVYITKEPYNGHGPTEHIPPPANHSSYSHYTPSSYPTAPSTPDSPDVQPFERTPPLSHAHLHFAQVPNLQPHASKSTMGTQGGRGNQSLNPSINRSVKSKTPPPNYKLVSHSLANGSREQTSKITDQSQYKQRHHSADDTLGKSGLPARGERSQSGSMELFNSLVGSDNIPPQSQGGIHGYTNMQLGVSGSRQPSQARSHQHSKSSPSTERRNILSHS